MTYAKGETSFTHPGMTAVISVDGKEIGYIGRVAHDVCADLAIEKPVILCELDYEALVPYLGKKTVYKPIPKFAEEVRDLAASL